MESSHHHHEERGHQLRPMALVLVLVAGYMVAEIAGGLLANSLALLADAGHMLSDVMALALSLIALSIAQRPPTTQHTYGYQRAEILAALVNGAMLIVIAVFIIVEAYHRLLEPPAVRGTFLFGIALGGLAINLISLKLLHGGVEGNLNVRAAWLHVLGDTAGSVGAIVAGALIWAFGWYIADPIISAFIGLLVIYSAIQLLAETTAVLMEWAPGHIDVDEVLNTLMAVPGIDAVHSLHIWSITSGIEALSGHVVAEDPETYPVMLHILHTLLHERFGIDHVTIQIEPENYHERVLAKM